METLAIQEGIDEARKAQITFTQWLDDAEGELMLKAANNEAILESRPVTWLY